MLFSHIIAVTVIILWLRHLRIIFLSMDDLDDVGITEKTGCVKSGTCKLLVALAKCGLAARTVNQNIPTGGMF